MYVRKDSYYKRAKIEGYKSRAAYKLLEINKKYQLIRNNSAVLDIGAAPGGWSQVALELAPRGKVAAVDIEDISGIAAENFFFFKGAVESEEVKHFISGLSPFDALLSDMAPHTTGIRAVDQEASLDLARLAIQCAEKFLKKDGGLLFKIFDGEERKLLTQKLAAQYKSVKNLRPDATRKSSFEMYILCKGKLEDYNVY